MTPPETTIPAPPADASLEQLLADYALRHPAESGEAERFRAFLASADRVFDRSHPPGHFTASCWLVSADGQHLLMTHHRKLDRWLQLGGHCDGDPDVRRAALREAEEESGLSGLWVEPLLFDIDRHRIPARGSEAEHWHYDLRFVIHAGAGEAFVVSDESHDLAWRSIVELADDPASEASIRRMAGKWLRRMANAAGGG